MIAALFVATDGAYSGLPGVDVWDEARDARRYAGPWPVIAHPPCQRWSSKGWHGSPGKPHQYAKGDDSGCFAAALASVRRWGGVLEHPAYSHAWLAHGLPWPLPNGWQRDITGGWWRPDQAASDPQSVGPDADLPRGDQRKADHLEGTTTPKGV